MFKIQLANYIPHQDLMSHTDVLMIVVQNHWSYKLLLIHSTIQFHFVDHCNFGIFLQLEWDLILKKKSNYFNKIYYFKYNIIHTNFQ